MSRQNLMLDYIDVAARIVEFRTKHPEGSLQQVALDFKQLGDTWWVIYTAAAYRTPDDARPGHGTAWEPVPGRTNFTRDSEVQNAETAAWGRAIVAAMAADTKRGVASAEEVRNSKEREAVRAPADVARDELAAFCTAHGFNLVTVGGDFHKAYGMKITEATADHIRAFTADLKGSVAA
jgi:hypothetical protein